MRPSSLLTSLAAAATLALALPAPAQAQSKSPATTAARPAARPAAKPAPAPRAGAARKPKPAAPVAAPPPPLAAASDEQKKAAELIFVGSYDCEFKQSLQVAPNPQSAAYFDVRLGKQAWVMKPVLSSTGARRLEDVQGRMLLLQIAFKSMLMDVQAGQRIVDDCVHGEQREAIRVADAQAATGGAPARGAAGTLLRLEPAPAAGAAATAAAVAVAGAAPGALPAAGVVVAAGGAPTLQLRILETTDVHMNLLGYDYYQDKAVEDYGLDRTLTLIKAARAEARNSLLIDNGDMLQGSPLGDYVAKIKPLQPGQLHPAYKVMNAIGYDAGNVGNHEFNYGLPFLTQSLGGAAFPVVNANLVVDDGLGKPAEAKNAFTPYVILERRFVDVGGAPQTLKVGVIGFAPPQVLLWDRQNLLGKIAAKDIAATARELVPKMKTEGADVIVVVAHSGFERGETPPLAENTVARLAEVPGVDAILFGHSHGEFPGRYFNTHPKVDLGAGTINGVPATMPGFWGSHLGVIDLTLQKTSAGWKATSGRAELRPIYDRAARKALVAADPMVAELVKTEHLGTLDYVRAPVASTATPIQSYFAQVADDPSVQLVSAAQLAYGKKAIAATPFAALPLLSAAAPFKTGGRGGANYYTDIAAGPIAVRNVADLYVYPNTVKIVRLTGAQVREWLEFSAGAFNRIDPAGAPEQNLINAAYPSFNFDTIDGVSYRIDVTQPARYNREGKLVAPDSKRVVDLRYNGAPIDDAAYFAVVTNNYRAAGGGFFPGLDGSNIIVDSPDENREALVQYLQAAGRVDPSADNNWSVQPVPGIKLQFTSGSGGIAHLPRYPQITLVKDNGDGSAVYQLQP